MSVTKEKISGKMIEVQIKSSSLKSASYDCLNGAMLVTFTNGTVYKYYEVPLDLFTKFRLANSQGQYFNKHISPNFMYRKMRK
jgi:KTSC domain